MARTTTDDGGIMETIPVTPERLYHLGSNYAADAVIIADDHLCLIQRQDTGQWALPGGFVDPGEDSLTTAKREAAEETALEVPGGILVYSGRVDDPRNTDTRWIETSAYLFTVNPQTVAAGDDAAEVKWWPLDQLPADLYGSHATIIEHALLARVLHSGKHQQTPVDGGHMSYRRSLLEHSEHGMMFIKAHDPKLHTDPTRSDNAWRYLQREANVMHHLRRANAPYIPDHSRLLPDTGLIMQGFAPHHGWRWKAPKGTMIGRYIDEALEAAEHLQSQPPPPADGIKPSHTTFHEEGWLQLQNPEVRQQVTQCLQITALTMRPETAAVALSLCDEIDALVRIYEQPADDQMVYFTHHDFRQSNLAWHPDHGIKIVDWSWAGAGPRHADSTALLIDLAKSGHDTSPYTVQYLNKDYALSLIGFWLTHSALPPSPHGGEQVRLQQAVSATTAYQLLIEQ